jgi:hypothetical protein
MEKSSADDLCIKNDYDDYVEGVTETVQLTSECLSIFFDDIKTFINKVDP